MPDHDKPETQERASLVEPVALDATRLGVLVRETIYHGDWISYRRATPPEIVLTLLQRLTDAEARITEQERLLAICRDNPRAQDEERIGELEAENASLRERLEKAGDEAAARGGAHRIVVRYNALSAAERYALEGEIVAFVIGDERGYTPRCERCNDTPREEYPPGESYCESCGSPTTYGPPRAADEPKASLSPSVPASTEND